MKKLLFCLCVFALTVPLMAQNEIPNGDMETWIPTIVRTPHLWQLSLGSVSRVTGRTGYACQLANDPSKNNPGVVLIGATSNGQVFYGGTPFTQRPDSIAAYFKYHIVAGDTAFFYVQLKKLGVPICAQWIPIVANNANSSTFVRIAKKITYSDTNHLHLPDSVIVGAICTNPNGNGNWPLGDTLTIDDIAFPGAAALPNSSFETWDSLTQYIPFGWYGISGSKDTAYSIIRTTDKYAGSYAALIQSMVTGTDTLSGIASTLPLQHDSNSYPSFKITKRYSDLTFAYKYFPLNGDTMSVYALLFKNGMQIGSAGYLSTTKDSVWKMVTTHINYYDTTKIIPDSATIFLSASSNHARGNSKLYIDNLIFAASPIIWKASALTSGSNIFTADMNSQNRQLSIKFQAGANEHISICLMDVTGRIINKLTDRTMQQGSYTISFDASHLGKGVYLVRKVTGNSMETRKVVLVR